MTVIQTNTISSEFSQDEVTLKVLEVLIDSVAIRHEDLKPTTELYSVGVDSLDVVEVVMELEDEFEIEIQDDALQGVDTIQGLIDVINKHISLKA